MKNYDSLKNLLSQTLRSVPEDFALQEIKFYIKKSISIIEAVEKKNQKKESMLKENEEKEKKNYKFETAAQANNALKMLDDMILTEQIKIEKIQAKRKNSNEPTADIQTIFD